MLYICKVKAIQLRCKKPKTMNTRNAEQILKSIFIDNDKAEVSPSTIESGIDFTR